jgi:23S rRNA pseudouridine2604 synthase
MENDNQNIKIRLSKLMSERGICSRREADAFIEKGLVFVDGLRINELGTKVDPNCHIELAAKANEQQQELVTIILNKPVGYVSSQPEDDYIPAIRLITDENRWIPDPQLRIELTQKSFSYKMLKGIAVAGRLDIDSQGILIFTSDGRIAKKIISPISEVEKEYLVRFQGDFNDKKLALLTSGLELDGRKLKPAKVDRLNPDQLRIVLKEGRKRQIRRMLELVDLQVTGLKRVRVGQLPLGKLPEGKWRFLEPSDRI